MVDNMVMARKQVLVQLDDELLARLDEVARQTGRNRSELIRRATRALVFQHENVEKDLGLIEGYLRQPQEPELLEWMDAIQQETFRATEW